MSFCLVMFQQMYPFMIENMFFFLFHCTVSLRKAVKLNHSLTPSNKLYAYTVLYTTNISRSQFFSILSRLLIAHIENLKFDQLSYFVFAMLCLKFYQHSFFVLTVLLRPIPCYPRLWYIYGSVQNCSNSIAKALELQQFCTKSSISRFSSMSYYTCTQFCCALFYCGCIIKSFWIHVIYFLKSFWFTSLTLGEFYDWIIHVEICWNISVCDLHGKLPWTRGLQ